MEVRQVFRVLLYSFFLQGEIFICKRNGTCNPRSDSQVQSTLALRTHRYNGHAPIIRTAAKSVAKIYYRSLTEEN